MVLLKNGSCPCNRCHPPRFLHLWEAHCVCVQGVVREAVELLVQMQRHLFETFVNDSICVQGVVREAVEELREQIQRHLFETFVKDCWLHIGSGERGCRIEEL